MALVPGFAMDLAPALVAYEGRTNRGFYRATESIGFGEGYSSGYAQGLVDGIPAQPGVSIVSPDPTVPAGDPGGFPADFEDAITTPIVLEVTAPDGIMIAVIVVRYRDELDAERVIYRRGAFRRGFAAASFLEAMGGNVWRFHCVPDGAWRVASANVLDDLAFDVDIAGGDPALSLSPIGSSS